jgi:hypothetical protein
MKKLVLAAVGSLLASLGGVVVSAPSATADPYVGYVPTNCRVKVDLNSGKRNEPRILALVEVPSSKAQPVGELHIVVEHQGEVVFDKTIKNKTGKTLKFFGPKKAKARKYEATLTFTPLAGTVYVGCEREASFKPKKNKNK